MSSFGLIFFPRTVASVGGMAVLLALAFLSAGAIAQQASLQEQIIGTWTLSSFYRECPDGNKSDVLGPNPQGLRIFLNNGRMSNHVMRSDLPKFASNRPQEGTADENKAVVQGTFLSFYGRYSVDEASSTVTYHIEGSVFPNANGTDQKRSVAITGDELKNVAPLGSCTGVMIWKRAP
jgi:hypothetical protein